MDPAPSHTTETNGSVTFDKLSKGQRTEKERPGAEEINDILAEPVAAVLSGGSSVSVYGQNYEDENGSGTRIVARIDSVGGERHEFAITENTVISEDENGTITVRESRKGTEQNGTSNNDVIIAFGSGTIHAGDGDDTILVFNIDRNDILMENATSVSITGGTGNDTVIAGNLNYSNVNLGEGDNSFSAEYLMNTSVSAGDGNNSFSAKNLNHGTRISAGDGDNAVSVDTSFSADVALGNGNNTYTANEQFLTHVTMGNGNNSLAIGNLGASSIRTGSGNDSISIQYAAQSSIKTGDGDDSLTISRINDSNFEWRYNFEDYLSNMIVDLGDGQNIFNLLESGNKLSVHAGANGSTFLSLSANATLTDAILGENVRVQRENNQP
jgi:hypothetical protein